MIRMSRVGLTGFSQNWGEKWLELHGSIDGEMIFIAVKSMAVFFEITNIRVRAEVGEGV